MACCCGLGSVNEIEERVTKMSDESCEAMVWMVRSLGRCFWGGRGFDV